MMKPSTLFDKMQVILEALFATPWAIIPAILLIAFILELSFRLKREDVETKKFFFIGFIILCLFLGIIYFTSITTGIDQIITGILTEYYFPSIATYMFIMVVSHITVILAIFKDWFDIYFKHIIIALFTILEIIFFAFLATMMKQKISLTDATKIYSNQDLLTMLEAATFVTVIGLVVIAGYYVVRHFKDKEDKAPKSNYEPIVMMPSSLVEVPQPVVTPAPEPVIVEKVIPGITVDHFHQVTKAVSEEQLLLKEQLKLLLLLQQKGTQDLKQELAKLTTGKLTKKQLLEQIEAFSILLHNRDITMEEELELMAATQQYVQKNVEKKIIDAKRHLQS